MLKVASRRSLWQRGCDMAQADPPIKFSPKLVSQWLIYVSYRCMETLLAMLPLTVVWHCGRALGQVAWFVAGKYRRLVLNNLRIAYGRERDEAWIQKTARAHFASLLANMISGFKLTSMSAEDILKRVTLEGMEHMQTALDSGRPVLGLVTHQSCWEILGQIPSLCSFGRKPATVYQPLTNPFMNAHILKGRERLGYAIFSRRDGFHGPVRHLREGGSLGVLVDQHTGDLGVWSPLFDRIGSTTPIASMIALRIKAIMVTLAVYDDGPGRWRVVYGSVNPPPVKYTFDSLTAEMNRFIEAMIRRQPESWFWVHNRWKTPNPKFLLPTYKRGIAFPQGYDQARLQPFEMLVRSPNWLGDACMAMSAVRAMKAGRPDLKITLLGPEKLRDLWEGQPEVSRYIGKEDKEGLFSVARKIKATGVPFDVAVLLTNSARSAYELRLAGIRELVGFKGAFRSKLLRHKVAEPLGKNNRPLHHVRRYLRIAYAVGAQQSKQWINDLADATLAAHSPTRIRIGICAGAEYGPAKRWPLERYAEVIQTVSASHPEIEWVFVGAPKEADMGTQLSALVSDVPHLNLVGKTKLSELMTELQSFRILVTNDTGTMHLASALKVPTVSLFGSTEPTLTGPLSKWHTVIRHSVPCSPCFKRECPFGHYECLTKITPAEVSTAVLTKLTALAGHS